MNRALIVATFSVMAVAVALAQADPIEARRALLKSVGSHFYGLSPMQKGEVPYDQTKVDTAWVQVTEAMQKLPALFPDSSKSGGAPNRYSASSKIWENRADFDLRLANLVKAVADAKGKTKSLDDLKVSYPAVNEACNACHERYRVRNN